MRKFCLLVMLMLLCGCVQQEKTTTTSTTSSPQTTTTSMTSTSAQASPQTSASTTSTSTTSSSLATPTTLTAPQPINDVLIECPWSETEPEVDGVASFGEWSDAKVLVSSNLDRLYVKNNDRYLFFLYASLDRNKYSNDTAVYVDPDGDGLYNHAYYDNKIFLIYPLVRGFEENLSYCGSHLLRAPEKDCGLRYEDIMADSRIVGSRSFFTYVSEARIPVSEAGANGSVYFFALYGYPALSCYPETMQCYKTPKFAEVKLGKKIL